MTFKLTYSTMFDPPPELHEQFEAALANVRGELGREYKHYIDGKDVGGDSSRDDISPIASKTVLGRFPVASREAVQQAVAAAKAAFPGWRSTPSAERDRLLRRVGEIIEERVYDISAAVALEVGKNRMEAIGEVQEP
jgi:1-pyrroline-5-carboxylate dehydrogenase